MYQLCKFSELSTLSLYEVLKVRSAVFIVEQNCAYQDIDDLDKHSIHLQVIDDESKSLMAYCRIIPPTYSVNLSESNHPKIGRVLVVDQYRKKGLARKFMLEAIHYCQTTYTDNQGRPLTIEISAQTYLFKFYQSLGFKSYGNSYLEDGIEHIDMYL